MQNDWRIFLAETAADLARCAPVMLQLRPHLSAEQFAAQVKRQKAQGYYLAALEERDAGKVRAVAGFRFYEMLAHGKVLYVDDLVTDESGRSKGYGAALLDWLVEQARAAECDSLQLDSGVQRFGAHRFYFRQGMHISSYHFKLEMHS